MCGAGVAYDGGDAEDGKRINQITEKGISQIFFLCKEHGGCWFETIFDDFLIDLIKFLLAVFLCQILFLSDFSFSRSKKIYLVKSFLLTPFHDCFLECVHDLSVERCL